MSNGTLNDAISEIQKAANELRAAVAKQFSGNWFDVRISRELAGAAEYWKRSYKNEANITVKLGGKVTELEKGWDKALEIPKSIHYGPQPRKRGKGKHRREWDC